MIAVTDTDGIFDRCHCGGWARIDKNYQHYTAECTECAEMVNATNKVELMTTWNKRMRKLKK